jgi:hypothetical protein
VVHESAGLLLVIVALAQWEENLRALPVRREPPPTDPLEDSMAPHLVRVVAKPMREEGTARIILAAAATN